jgi:RNA polymerase-interacting CarD/CdnL/TRCF family regulator
MGTVFYHERKFIEAGDILQKALALVNNMSDEAAHSSLVEAIYLNLGHC